MTTIDEIHRENLKLLAKEAGGKGALAERIGKSASQVSQWLNGSSDSKTGKARGIRPDSCRAIEMAFKKSPGWMDAQHSEVQQAPQKRVSREKIATSQDVVTADEIIELITLYKDAPPADRKMIMEAARLHRRRKQMLSAADRGN